MRPLRILSLGAGVQSTTVALMAAHGEIPPIDAAIFADTQAEPRGVYEHLARLTAPGVLPFPVYVLSHGSLTQEILDACEGREGAWGRPPFFVRNPDGSQGLLNRQCTEDYKLAIIDNKIRELAGIPKRKRPKGIRVVQLLGISIDEAHRQKGARFAWVRNEYPLIDAMLHRGDCERKLAAWGFLRVPKSSCTFCPWDFKARIAEREAALKAKQLRLYLPAEDGFGNECEGHCGV